MRMVRGSRSPMVNCLWLEIQSYIAEADADLIPVPGQYELHGRCGCGSMLWCSLLVADLIVGGIRITLPFELLGLHLTTLFFDN